MKLGVVSVHGLICPVGSGVPQRLETCVWLDDVHHATIDTAVVTSVVPLVCVWSSVSPRCAYSNSVR
jgi:hypothetical protein